MADREHGTSIEWTHGDGYRGETWNPVTGCSKVSPGCANCYAETISLRFHRSVGPWTPANAAQNVVLHPERLDQPLRWRKPRMVFVNSMSDLFHELVPDEYIQRVFDVMAAAPQHVFQVLTKRPDRMRDFRQAWHAAHLGCGVLPNVWLGTSIENRRFVHRADCLRATPAAVRFISAEPLLGPLVPHVHGIQGHHKGWNVHGRGVVNDDPGLDLTDIDWLIVGGESGAHCRPMRTQWAQDLRDACARAGTAFFLKQLGGVPDKRGGEQAVLDGRRHTAMPAAGVPA